MSARDQAAAKESPRSTTQASTRRPLVVGAPRSGFSLMTVIVGTIAPNPPVPPREVSQSLAVVQSAVNAALTGPFVAAYGPDKVLFNPNFQDLFGGPKYIDTGSDRFRVRKYLGVIDEGDIIINLFLPYSLLSYMQLFHFHHVSRRFLTAAADKITLFQTIRNPAGVVNSACHSLNVLTSEYIQRANPKLQQQDIRSEVAFNKMVRPDVFASLCRFYAQNYEHYYFEDAPHTIRWEDTIDHSVDVMARVADALGIKASRDSLMAEWAKMDHRNLTGAHKHNFREGYGVVGDWKNWLVPQHLEIMRDSGLKPLFERLGYEYPSAGDLEPFNTWQRKCMYGIDHHLEYTPMLDHNLLRFSENKSNAAIDRPTSKGKHITIENCGLEAQDLIQAALANVDDVFSKTGLH